MYLEKASFPKEETEEAKMVLETVTTSRDRRVTAGKRMTALVGKAQEEDELFWGNDTWASDLGEASEDESYNVEEEAEINRIDVFDSDFNDSEEEEDDESSDAVEQQIRQQEKQATSMAAGAAKHRGGAPKKATTKAQPPGEIYNKIAEYFHPAVAEAARIQYKSLAAAAAAAVAAGHPQPPLAAAARSSTSSAARSLIIKKKSKEKQKKSVMGTGWNAGIVLNLPNSAEILSNALQTLIDMQNDVEEKERQQQLIKKQHPLEELSEEQHRTRGDDGLHDSVQSEAMQSVCSIADTKTVCTDRQEPAHPSLPINALSPPPEKGYETKPAATADRLSPSTNKTLRNLRAKTLDRTFHTVRTQAKRSAKSPSAVSTTAQPDKQKSDKKHVPTQEEMLIEAANETEPENERWLLARQRFAAAGGSNNVNKVNINKKISSVNNNNNNQVIQRFHSRRGCYNTITFPEMDLIPEFWKKFERRTNNRGKTPENITKIRTCIITGLPAKYCDPKTGFPYANVDAYQEIKRLYHTPKSNQVEKCCEIKSEATIEGTTAGIDVKKKLSRNTRKRPPTDSNIKQYKSNRSQQAAVLESEISCQDVSLRDASRKKVKLDTMTPTHTLSSSTILPLEESKDIKDFNATATYASTSIPLDLSGSLPPNTMMISHTTAAGANIPEAVRSSVALEQHRSSSELINNTEEAMLNIIDAPVSKSERNFLEEASEMAEVKSNPQTESTASSALESKFLLSTNLEKKIVPWVAKALTTSKGDSE